VRLEQPVAAWSSAGLALFTAGLALEQHPVPTDYKGVTESVLATRALPTKDASDDNRSRVPAPKPDEISGWMILRNA
jgi:hypothetical protein